MDEEKLLGTATILNKGVMTFPVEGRRYLKLKPGDEICILLEHGQVVIKRKKASYENFDIKD